MRGDVKQFAAFDHVAKSGVAFNLSSDTLNLGIVTASPAPLVSTADPRWGAGGTTNFATTQVGTGGGYTGPVTLESVTFTRSSGVVTLTFANVVIPSNASGFTDGAYAIIYDDTVAGKYCIGFIDLGGPVSIVGGALNINVNASGFAADTAS